MWLWFASLLGGDRTDTLKGIALSSTIKAWRWIRYISRGARVRNRIFSFPPRRSVKLNSKLGLFGYGNILMAAVGPTRQSRVSMSVSMSLVQGGAAGASAAGTVLGTFVVSSSLHSLNIHRFIAFDSCCRSILSGAQHPSRCPTWSPHRLRRIWSCLVSFTFQPLCKFALHEVETIRCGRKTVFN